jgi:hypothetical protein
MITTCLQHWDNYYWKYHRILNIFWIKKKPWIQEKHNMSVCQWGKMILNVLWNHNHQGLGVSWWKHLRGESGDGSHRSTTGTMSSSKIWDPDKPYLCVFHLPLLMPKIKDHHHFWNIYVVNKERQVTDQQHCQQRCLGSRNPRHRRRQKLGQTLSEVLIRGILLRWELPRIKASERFCPRLRIRGYLGFFNPR